MGCLYVDLLTENGYLIDGVNVHAKLMRSHAAFSIVNATDNIGINATPDFKIILAEVLLHVREVKVNATCHLVITEAMKIAPARFPNRHVKMASFSIPGQVKVRPKKT